MKAKFYFTPIDENCLDCNLKEFFSQMSDLLISKLKYHSKENEVDTSFVGFIFSSMNNALFYLDNSMILSQLYNTFPRT